jgi:hypothetical protein
LLDKYFPSIPDPQPTSSTIEFKGTKSTIDFCKKLHSDVCDAKVSFLCSDIDDLPMLENVTHVYLADVVEHLYDNELNKLLLIISKWNLNENFPLLIIHTDNNLYIKFFRPIVDLFMLLFCKTSFLEICNRNAFEKPRHVNLMSPNQLNKKLLHFIKKDCVFKQLQ